MPDFKHIDTIDLPSDPNGALGRTRTEIMRAYNKNRMSLTNMELLHDTLVHVLREINEGFRREVLSKEQVRASKNQETINRAIPEEKVALVKPKRKRAAKRTPKGSK